MARHFFCPVPLAARPAHTSAMTAPPLDRKAALLAMLAEIELDLDYDAIDTSGFEPDLQGWGDQDPIFDYVVRHFHPVVILELGSWKGASAIRMADLLRDYNIPGLVLCIDTWLGSNESLWRVAENRQMLRLRNGYPDMFGQFIRNIQHSGHQQRIRHLPMTTGCAAGLLAAYNIVPDAIYIDAGHDEAEVAADIAGFWPLLKPGGIMFGDDYTTEWPGTVRAVNRFVADQGLKLMGTEVKWLVRKPEA